VPEISSIGLIELSSVATGFLVQDTMLKAGNIKLLMARSICSGKYLIVVSGDVTSVAAAVQAGGVAAGPSLIERRQIARVLSRRSQRQASLKLPMQPSNPRT